MPYQGLAFAVLLGFGVATAIFLCATQLLTGTENRNGPYGYQRPVTETENWSLPQNSEQRKRKRWSGNPNVQCTICISVLDNSKKELLCGHCFHAKCINRWLAENNTCPICRITI